MAKRKKNGSPTPRRKKYAGPKTQQQPQPTLEQIILSSDTANLFALFEVIRLELERRQKELEEKEAGNNTHLVGESPKAVIADTKTINLT